MNLFKFMNCSKLFWLIFLFINMFRADSKILNLCDKKENTLKCPSQNQYCSGWDDIPPIFRCFNKSEKYCAFRNEMCLSNNCFIFFCRS